MKTIERLKKELTSLKKEKDLIIESIENIESSLHFKLNEEGWIKLNIQVNYYHSGELYRTYIYYLHPNSVIPKIYLNGNILGLLINHEDKENERDWDKFNKWLIDSKIKYEVF